jgi:hypothetical protein
MPEGPACPQQAGAWSLSPPWSLTSPPMYPPRCSSGEDSGQVHRELQWVDSRCAIGLLQKPHFLLLSRTTKSASAMSPPHCASSNERRVAVRGPRKQKKYQVLSPCPRPPPPAALAPELTMLALLAFQALPVLFAQFSGPASFPLPVLGFPLLVVRKAIY